MTNEQAGRIRLLFTILLAIALPAGLLLQGVASAYMNGQAIRTAVADLLQSLPRAEEPKPVALPGCAANDAERKTMTEVANQFVDAVQTGKLDAAWAMVAPETAKEWTKDEWIVSMGGIDESPDTSGGMPEMMTFMMLKQGAEVVDVYTMKDQGWAKLKLDVEKSGTVVLVQSEGQWKVDLARTNAMMMKKEVENTFGKKTSDNFFDQIMSMSMMGMSEFSSRPSLLSVIQPAVTKGERIIGQVNVDGDSGYVNMTQNDSTGMLLAMKQSSSGWVINSDDEPRVIALDVDLASIVFAEAGNEPRGNASNCLSNVKQLNLAMLMYASDYDEKFPPANKWCDVSMPYCKNKETYKCPSDDVNGSYAMNFKLSKLDDGKVMMPAETIILFETEPSRWNAYDKDAKFPGVTMALPARHNGSNSFGYVDGHAKLMKPDFLNINQWRPVPETGGPMGMMPGGPPGSMPSPPPPPPAPQKYED